jgi:hypothetical protein
MSVIAGPRYTQTVGTPHHPKVRELLSIQNVKLSDYRELSTTAVDVRFTPIRRVGPACRVNGVLSMDGVGHEEQANGQEPAYTPDRSKGVRGIIGDVNGHRVGHRRGFAWRACSSRTSRERVHGHGR